MHKLRGIYWVLACFAWLCLSDPASSQEKKTTLSVDEIMLGEQWIGVSPKAIQWDPNSQLVYFKWASGLDKKESVYQVSIKEQKAVESAVDLLPSASEQVHFSKSRSRVLYEKDGDIILRDMSDGKATFLTRTVEREFNPIFSMNEDEVIFQRGDNLFSLTISGGEIVQLSNFIEEEKLSSPSEQDKALREKQMETFAVLRLRGEEKKRATKDRLRGSNAFLKAFYVRATEKIGGVVSSPDKRFITFNVESNPAPARTIFVPDYVSSSGYTEAIPGRAKVGGQQPTYKSYIYDRLRDSIYPILTASIPGIKDIPIYLKEYAERYQQVRDVNADREVQITGYWWSADAKRVVVNIMAQDHKDRWIMALDPLSGKLKLLDKQHDEAWIAGPGIAGRTASMGWVNNETFYFQSEASGYSHVYTVDVANGTRKRITSGKYEVLTLQLAQDKQYFYVTANREHPGRTEFYRVAVTGGNPEAITALEGENEVFLSPDEKWLAIRHSYINKPWELYLQKNEAKAKAVQLTKSTSPQFDAYPWRIPETITFRNRHGVDVYAQVFRPKIPDTTSRAAIVFVHSNGYLQNVHDGWSYHYREYLFNNLLVDLGYTVINIDYTGSAGYGRNFRTGIYRHMGGQDLTDLVDGAQLLVEKYGVDPARIGLYGGSYGGFLTLMALFTQGDTFKSGAALRSVTDWSNYNQRYTSNILNNPLDDPEAYRQSSPLFFADGLKGNLLMTHGVVDVNVNFQDIVLLTQKLIELKKENWELAIYPKEDHDFVDAVSWTDQYKRILKLFNQTLK